MKSKKVMHKKMLHFLLITGAETTNHLITNGMPT